MLKLYPNVSSCAVAIAYLEQMAFGEGPALAAGNSLDDGPMISYARGLGLVCNPNSAALELLAQEKGWSVHHIGSIP